MNMCCMSAVVTVNLTSDNWLKIKNISKKRITRITRKVIKLKIVRDIKKSSLNTHNNRFNSLELTIYEVLYGIRKIKLIFLTHESCLLIEPHRE